MLGDKFEHFQSLGSFEKASFVLGSELWEHKFHSTLDRQSYILDVWELRKIRLYGNNPSIEQSQSEIAPGELQGVAGGGGGGGGWSCGETNTGISVCSSNVGSTLLIMYFLCIVCLLSSGSAHSSGCVVNGSSAMSAS